MQPIGRVMNRSVLRLAVVDAGTACRQQTTELLRKLGHWVDANFLVAQLANLAEARLDAVVVDVASLSIQEVEGLAAQALTNPFPIVTTSSSASDELIDRANARHSFAHLIKPLGDEPLSAAIRIAIDRCGELVALRQEISSTRQSLADRKSIEQAKGILMRSMGNDEAKAFKHMQRLARQSRRPLVEIAYGIIAVGAVTPDAPALQ
jgi:response regulator NasT